MVNRIVVGAHYGLRDWLAQRVTAVIMLVYAVGLVALLLSASGQGYEGWKALFQQTWVRVISSVTVFALMFHAWVGIRDIWMDYVQPVGIRLALQIFTIVWLVGCAGWAIQVLWRV